jgi:hypothetical protein
VRAARTFAALVALATVAFTVGDFASHPNPLGALGILALIALFALLLAYLFRPAKAPAPPRPEPVPEPEPRRPAKAAGVWADGWDAGEAREARERRRRR